MSKETTVQETHPLDCETAQLFVDRIIDQANPYNTVEITSVNTQEIAAELSSSARRVAGQLVGRYVQQMDYSKMPVGERTAADMEKTQEMPIPGVEVLVRTVRLSADPRLVPFGEDPRHYPRGNRQRFFLANVLE